MGEQPLPSPTSLGPSSTFSRAVASRRCSRTINRPARSSRPLGRGEPSRCQDPSAAPASGQSRRTAHTPSFVSIVRAPLIPPPALSALSSPTTTLGDADLQLWEAGVELGELCSSGDQPPPPNDRPILVPQHDAASSVPVDLQQRSTPPSVSPTRARDHTSVPARFARVDPAHHFGGVGHLRPQPHSDRPQTYPNEHEHRELR